MISVYGTETAVSGDDFVTDVTSVWNKVLQLKNGPLALSFLAQRNADFEKQS